MDKPLISICIPCYNRADLIEETINSALNQTYPNIEIIINDNCSTDGTWAILEQYAQKHNQIKIFQNASNLGAVKNWQQATSHATGAYALILWSDDLIEPEFIEKTYALFDDNCAFVLSENVEFATDRETPTSNFGSKGQYTQEEYFNVVLFKNLLRFPYSPAGTLFRTKDLQANIFHDIPNTDGIDFNLTGAGPDLLLQLIVASKYPYFRVVPEVLARWRSHPESITVLANKKKGLKLNYDWGRYHFVANYRKELLGKYKAITWVRYHRYGKIHKNMLHEMKNVNMNIFFLIKLFLS